ATKPRVARHELPWVSLRFGITYISDEKLLESRRDFATKPRVARHELPWVGRISTSQPRRGCVPWWSAWSQPRWGCDAVCTISQGSSQARNLGLDDTIPLGLPSRPARTSG